VFTYHQTSIRVMPTATPVIARARGSFEFLKVVPPRFSGVFERSSLTPIRQALCRWGQLARQPGVLLPQTEHNCDTSDRTPEGDVPCR
jgi:hypothetical protein